jgi:hypothetical protein
MPTITLRPTSDNANNNFWNESNETTSLYASVDESSLNESDYNRVIGNSQSISGYIYYNWENPSVSSGTITDVIFYVQAKRIDDASTAGTLSFVMLNDHSTSISLTTSSALYHNHYTVNPHTGVAWTWQNITDLVAGFDGYAYNFAYKEGDDSSVPYIYQTYIQVVYEEATSTFKPQVIII